MPKPLIEQLETKINFYREMRGRLLRSMDRWSNPEKMWQKIDDIGEVIQAIRERIDGLIAEQEKGAA